MALERHGSPKSAFNRRTKLGEVNIETLVPDVVRKAPENEHIIH